VDDALGNALAVLVRQLLDQLVILQQQRATRAGRVTLFWLSGSGAPAVVVSVRPCAGEACVSSVARLDFAGFWFGLVSDI
jgi:hypothetical protein